MSNTTLDSDSGFSNKRLMFSLKRQSFVRSLLKELTGDSRLEILEIISLS